MYDVNYEVQMWYDGVHDGQGFHFVKSSYHRLVAHPESELKNRIR